MVLYGLGTFQLSPSSRSSLQLKRAASEVYLVDECSELSTESFKMQLTSSPSYQHLTSQGSVRPSILKNSPKSPAMYFWTPKYRYRPKPARDFYLERQKHLKLLKDFHESIAKKRNKRKKRCFRRCRETDEESLEELFPKKPRKKYNFINMFSSRVEELFELSSNRNPKETHTQFLKRMLRMDLSLTIWDFNSSTLAEQLTIIHKELFLKISAEELESLLLCKTSKYAPNLLALLTFSERITCLIATEILKNDTEKSRARLIARLINVVQKCHKISNFQTCKTILSGLQSPSIYRLKETWAYVRKKHASKYRTFEFLCRLYRDPRLISYQKAFYMISLNPPFMPYIGDILTRLLNKVPQYSFKDRSRSVSRKSSYETVESSNLNHRLQSEAAEKSTSLFSKFIQVFHNPEPSMVQTSLSKSEVVKKKIHRHRKASKCKGLCEYYESNECERYTLESLVETVELLGKCQLGTTGYNFKVNEIANSYLLKARYQDDKENFIKSLSVEPAAKYL
ncbi:unnamed protein product [Acanthoscelides obtectus]|uniref:Ras-GEF domain-containing protein n=1 Tax=Acanthoscelides obtectus TaxID=200917 RepID=A0A9P0PNV1_ACAOB|nr:unnamed protein product [Acanthoscelides obtectus]CAK1661222.1 Ras guanine nucleotide exchange factor E [Acanthoscelides obtectus]